MARVLGENPRNHTDLMPAKAAQARRRCSKQCDRPLPLRGAGLLAARLRPSFTEPTAGKLSSRRFQPLCKVRLHGRDGALHIARQDSRDDGTVLVQGIFNPPLLEQ